SRILKAAQQHDPLAVAHMIPGPEPLRRLLRAAEKKKVNSSLIRRAAAALDRFEQLIDREAGDRSALDAIISGWLPHPPEQVELIAKQSVSRGPSHWLGNACDVVHFTTMLHPSRAPSGSGPIAGAGERADWVWINVTHGVRRVRPGPIMSYDTIHTTQPLYT